MAEDLLETKIQLLRRKISDILDEHKYDDAGKFLDDVSHEIIDSAEHEASKIRRYITEISKLIQIRDNLEYFEEE